MIEEKEGDKSPHVIERSHIIRFEFGYSTTVVCMPNVTFYINSRHLNEELGFTGRHFFPLRGEKLKGKTLGTGDTTHTTWIIGPISYIANTKKRRE